MINGEMTEQLAATDRGLHYGDGLFETVAIINGRPRLWSHHMERLQHGCAVLQLPPPDPQQLHAEALTLCGDAERAVLKLLLTRGSGGRGYRPPPTVTPQRLLFRYPWPDYPDLSQGACLRLCQMPLTGNPRLAGVKHLNRLEQVMARAEWEDPAIHEGVMCDLEGWVREGTMSNLFWVEGERLYTPDLSRCGVHGVMRGQVMALAKEMGIGVASGEITPQALAQVDEIFLTNSLIGIWPVGHFAGRDFSPGEVTRNLRSMLQMRLEVAG
ncbi:MAG: aminodeoxychorismate lyase [Gammaproteobacteria bacterium]|nr:aminodeoxychorismate lyase [Gammaproteobacteria bacterium]